MSPSRDHIFGIPDPYFPVHYNFYGAQMTIKGRLQMKILQWAIFGGNFQSENFPNCPVLGSGGQRFKKVLIFAPKGTSLRESTSFKRFCVKIG